MNTRRCRTLLVLVLLGMSTTAAAQSTRFGEPRRFRSKQQFYLELKFGTYSPNIDTTPFLTGTPFSDLFSNKPGDGKRPGRRLLTTVGFEWQFWHKFGSLGVAGSVGVMRRSTQALAYGADGTTPCVFTETLVCPRSGDPARLTVMPFALELVYRFDVLAQRFRVPLVPYLKGGLAYYLWWTEDGNGLSRYGEVVNGECVRGDCSRGIGGTFGLVAHPGLAIQLDGFDPRASQALDAELGINHVYLYGELNYAWINGFNARDRLVLSDLSWNAGIAFEF